MFCKTEQADGCAAFLLSVPSNGGLQTVFLGPVEMLIFTRKPDTNCGIVGYSQDANAAVSSDDLSLMCLTVCSVHRHVELEFNI